MELRATIVISLNEEEMDKSSWSIERLQTYFTHLLETTVDEQMPAGLIQAHFIQTKKTEEV